MIKWLTLKIAVFEMKMSKFGRFHWIIWKYNKLKGRGGCSLR